MEIDAIQTLIASFKEANLTSLSLKCEAFELKLGKEDKLASHCYEEVEETNKDILLLEKISNNASIKSMQEPTTKNEKMVVSPMVGTFYAAANPNAAPLVKVGDYVKKGDVVCIVEAMKLMNEVEAEVEGTVVEILVSNEDMVEYNQPLFILK